MINWGGRPDAAMKIEYIIDDSIRDYSATGNRPENSFTQIHPPVHPTPTRRTSQTRVAAGALAIIVDTPKNCQAVKSRSLTAFSVTEKHIADKE